MDITAPVKNLTWKKLILYIITFFWVILLLKWVVILFVRGLDKFREYLHNLTNKEKMLEVLSYTIIGMVLGVLLNKQILKLVAIIVEFWNGTILPWLKGIFSIF